VLTNKQPDSPCVYPGRREVSSGIGVGTLLKSADGRGESMVVADAKLRTLVELETKWKLSCVRISGVHEEVGGRDDGLGFGSGASQRWIFRRKLPNKANLRNEFFTRRSRQVTPCSLANNNMPSTTAPPPPIPTLTSLTSHLSTPRLQQAVHPHRWTPLYVAFLNIHTARRTYTPPSSPPSLTPKLSRLHSIFTHPDPYILKAQRILDTGHESRWATCILTLTSHPTSYTFLHELLFISSPLLAVDESYGTEVIQDLPHPKITGFRALATTRCPLRLRFRDTAVEFHATGFVQSSIRDRPLVDIVDLKEVKHRDATIAAHILIRMVIFIVVFNRLFRSEKKVVMCSAVLRTNHRCRVRNNKQDKNGVFRI